MYVYCYRCFRNAKFDRISELSAKEIDNTVEQNVEMWIRAICWDVFCMEVIEKQRRLQIIANNLKTIRLRQFFNHWKTVAMKSSRRKRLLSEFPVRYGYSIRKSDSECLFATEIACESAPYLFLARTVTVLNLARKIWALSVDEFLIRIRYRAMWHFWC